MHDMWASGIARNKSILLFPFRRMSFSGHLYRPCGSVIENYDYSLDWYESIFLSDDHVSHSFRKATAGKWVTVLYCRPCQFICVDPFPEAELRYDNPVLYHYYTRSLEDFISKLAKHEAMPDPNWYIVTHESR
jgi:hypothetical protein